MRYVLLGKLSSEWANKPERITKSKKKIKELGIKLVSVFYTQGAYDFVDVVEVKETSAILAFSVWYVTQGYGSFTTMPAFTSDEFDEAVKLLAE